MFQKFHRVSYSSNNRFLSRLIKKSLLFDNQKFNDSWNHYGDHHHYYHCTQDKEIFGTKNSEENFQEHVDIVGNKHMKIFNNVKRANSLFGSEDKEFENGQYWCGVDKQFA